MKKVMFCLLTLITLISMIICGLKIKEYDEERFVHKYDETKSNTEIKIKEVNKEIDEKNVELENTKELKKEEVEIVELWKKKVEEIKQYL